MKANPFFKFLQKEPSDSAILYNLASNSRAAVAETN